MRFDQIRYKANLGINTSLLKIKEASEEFVSSLFGKVLQIVSKSKKYSADAGKTIYDERVIVLPILIEADLSSNMLGDKKHCATVCLFVKRTT